MPPGRRVESAEASRLIGAVSLGRWPRGSGVWRPRHTPRRVRAALRSVAGPRAWRELASRRSEAQLLVTVWVTLWLFVQVTVPPVLTVTDAGLNPPDVALTMLTARFMFVEAGSTTTVPVITE